MLNRAMAVLVCASLALLIACRSNSGPLGGAKQYFVAFSQCNNAEPYRAAQNALMTRLWAKYPDVKFVMADAGQDDNKQIAQIDTFIRQSPDLLIVAPNERAPLTAVMGRAVQAGIPVICLERDILQPNYTTFVGADNLEIGRKAGQFIVDFLTKKYGRPQGNIVQIKGLLGVEGEIKRNDGAREVFEKYPSIKIVHDAVADWIQAKAKDG
jgi:ribose transport system substrate-binding protein